MKKVSKAGWIIAVSLMSFFHAHAQGILNRQISIDINRQQLPDVLEIISNKGNFYFSYNSRIVKRDTLITFTARNRTIRDILSQLFDQSYEFRESGNYLIIRKAPIRLTLVTDKAALEERIYSVSGYVYDEQSGSAINEASVYEKRLLASALTNTDGFFKIRLKSGKAATAELTVSKQFYEDTTVVIQPRHSQQLTITLIPFDRVESNVIISPGDYLVPDSLKAPSGWPDGLISTPVFTEADTTKVEKTKLGRFFLSTKQKAQSLNLRNFFTTRPFQASLTPGLSSHGYMSGQVVNNFSLNVFGGYTAGTNGVEIGGLFNINKKAVRYFQVGGVFNVVGGQLQGIQVAGVHNTVLDTVSGFQIAGVNNIVKGKFRGFQVAGVYNHVTDSMKGFQIAGVANFTRKKVSGLQIAGVANVSKKETDGVQIAGLLNYAKKLRGVQIGVINISDTSGGFSIGLINIVLKGYHKLGIFSDETLNLNVAFKTGSSKLYNILTAGTNAAPGKKAFAFGYGLGSELKLDKKNTLTFNPELTSQYVYLGSWDYHNVLNRARLNINVRLNKWVSIYAGPSFAVHLSDQPSKIGDYRSPLPPSGYKTIDFSNRVKGWLGWNAGINIF